MTQTATTSAQAGTAAKTNSAVPEASAAPAKKRAPAKRAAPARKPAAKRPATAKKVAPARTIAAKKVAKPLATPAPTPAPATASTKPAAAPKAAVAATAAGKMVKDKKPKMVRDSVTIPKAEYMVLDAMKLRAAQLKVTVKKTELIRAGIKQLSSLSDTVFLAAIAAVPSLKTGRPSKA
jgi:hypothetical protein